MILDYQIVNSPIWINECNHPKESYVGSVKDIIIRYSRMEVDVYVEGDNICIRFGNKPSEYYSPSIISLIQNYAYEPYTSSLNLLLRKGRFAWIAK